MTCSSKLAKLRLPNHVARVQIASDFKSTGAVRLGNCVRVCDAIAYLLCIDSVLAQYGMSTCLMSQYVDISCRKVPCLFTRRQGTQQPCISTPGASMHPHQNACQRAKRVSLLAWKCLLIGMEMSLTTDIEMALPIDMKMSLPIDMGIFLRCWHRNVYLSALKISVLVHQEPSTCYGYHLCQHGNVSTHPHRNVSYYQHGYLYPSTYKCLYTSAWKGLLLSAWKYLHVNIQISLPVSMERFLRCQHGNIFSCQHGNVFAH